MAGDNSPAILANDLHKSFGSGAQRTEILHGISLEVARGETLFLVGPSGSGKTTLLTLLGCVLTPDSGCVQVLGREVSQMKSKQLTDFRRQNLGFVFQSFNLFPTLSAFDNVRLALTMRGVSLREASLRASELLSQVGMVQRRHLRPAHLSTGECQRVAVARALADEPRLLFADEPTAALDAENGQAVMGLLTRLVRHRQATLVVVTHDPRIFSFADRVLRLEDGRLTSEVQGSSAAGQNLLEPESRILDVGVEALAGEFVA
jgi:putative ABC transport system ATP-binding protein